jgi:RNA polymerase sigma-70 factor (ECF subfamily)
MTHGLGLDASPGARLAAGDAYAAFGPVVLAYLRQLVPREEADRLMPVVFDLDAVWRHGGHGDPSGGLAALLLARARDLVTDHLRHRHSTGPVEGTAGAAAEDPGALAERHLRAAAVRGALSRLPGEQREVLTLAYFHHHSQPEIATRLAIPLRRVKELAFDGLRGLAVQLREPEYHPRLSPPRGDVPFVGPE